MFYNDIHGYFTRFWGFVILSICYSGFCYSDILLLYRRELVPLVKYVCVCVGGGEGDLDGTLGSLLEHQFTVLG